MIAPEYSGSYHRDTDRTIVPPFFLAGRHLLHRTLNCLPAPAIQLQQLRHLVFRLP